MEIGLMGQKQCLESTVGVCLVYEFIIECKHFSYAHTVPPDNIEPHRPIIIGEMNMMTLPRLLSTICDKVR